MRDGEKSIFGYNQNIDQNFQRMWSLNKTSQNINK